MRSYTHQYSFYNAAVLLVMVAAMAFSGCSSDEEKKRPDFFTSGNPEADQRAEQRMAKSEQLKDSKDSKPGMPDRNAKNAKADENRSLYDRLGGQQGITAIVDDFVPRAMADPRVNWDRKGVKQGGFSIHRGRPVTWNATPEAIKNLKIHMVQFLSLSTGGPSEYSGKEMKQAHAGLHITNAEFDAAVGDLKASLDKISVPVKEQKELLAIVESTRAQIAEDR